MPNGVEVPQGPVIQYHEKGPAGANGIPVNPMLAANEFVVYNTNQIRMRYIVQVCKKSKEEIKKAKWLSWRIKFYYKYNE